MCIWNIFKKEITSSSYSDSCMSKVFEIFE